ncbi:MAG: PIG-L family deacetylase [Bdellovibrionales bacterium]|nr:PIG-L family deacetylase [Bdellovibrionales bacterium]
MDFSRYVDQIEALYLAGLPEGQRKSFSALTPLSQIMGEVPKRLLIIAPHPDDECLMSGLALRAKEECGAEVAVLAYGFGSDPARRDGRKEEFKKALQVLGFKELVSDPADLRGAIHSFRPEAILIPNLHDSHPTHIRCSEEAWDAARATVSAGGMRLTVLESEYWGPMGNPNLLIPLSSSTVKRMGLGLLCHEGEIARNPYHLSLPAFLIDQQRRGSEIVSGFGAKPSPSIFAQLYRATTLSPEAWS